jgi:hypothetical protein
MKLKDFKMLETEMPKGVQAILDFGEYELSIVQNESSYGNKQGLYEIAVFKGNGQVELPGITAEGDTVKGYLTEEDVNMILKKMYLLTGKIPQQV